jgi:hypothetical protein
MIITTDNLSVYSLIKRKLEKYKTRRRETNPKVETVILAEREYIKTKEEEDKQKANDLVSKLGGFIIRI